MDLQRSPTLIDPSSEQNLQRGAAVHPQAIRRIEGLFGRALQIVDRPRTALDFSESIVKPVEFAHSRKAREADLPLSVRRNLGPPCGIERAVEVVYQGCDLVPLPRCPTGVGAGLPGARSLNRSAEMIDQLRELHQKCLDQVIRADARVEREAGSIDQGRDQLADDARSVIVGSLRRGGQCLQGRGDRGAHVEIVAERTVYAGDLVGDRRSRKRPTFESTTLHRILKVAQSGAVTAACQFTLDEMDVAEHVVGQRRREVQQWQQEKRIGDADAVRDLDRAKCPEAGAQIGNHGSGLVVIVARGSPLS